MHDFERARTHALLPASWHAVTTALLHSASARAAQNSVAVLRTDCAECWEWVGAGAGFGGASVSLEPAAHPQAMAARLATRTAANDERAYVMAVSPCSSDYLTTILVS
jgi:hypothetical protein